MEKESKPSPPINLFPSIKISNMSTEVKSYLVGVFDDDDVLLNAIRDIRSKGAKILEEIIIYITQLSHALIIKITLAIK
jgi:hypothetical protein